MANLLLDPDTNQWKQPICDSDGRQKVTADLEVTDIQIGAVEIKDATASTRVNVSTVGSTNIVHMGLFDSSGNQISTFTATAKTLSDRTATQDLSSGALSQTTSEAADFKLIGIQIHASTSITETVTISIDNAAGANYDTVIASKAFTAETDWFYQPDVELIIKSGNEITLACTNANTTGIVYATIMVESR